jgi:N6-L-threonylcarbamoyladenine synthase
MKKVTLLAIETSCDETGVAVVQKNGDKVSILSNQVASQIDVHALTGGVVPEVAAREHVQVIKPMVEKAMQEAKTNPQDIDGIAVTVGPGLIPALAVGVMVAKTVSYLWKKPIVPVHHIEGHIYSALLREDSKITFPALALIVSGGHTLLIEVKGHLQYTIIGSTIDDAAGEAFDKVARLLGLPYPGGPHLSRLALTGNPTAYKFPRPMLDSGDLNLSFSGLKTSVLYKWREIAEQAQAKADIAASFEQAVVDTLTAKTQAAINQIKPNIVLLAGGVAANQKLKQEITKLVQKNHLKLHIAPNHLTGDNAAMIGQAGVFAWEAGRQQPWSQIDATARLNIESFSLSHSG